MKHFWTPEEKQQLSECYPVLTMPDLINMLGKSAGQIKSAARRLKLLKKGKLISWRYADELKLIELYPHMSNAELGNLLNKKESSVASAAFKLQLFKTEAFHRERSAKGHFTNGHTPFNKGKKQLDYSSPEAIARSAKTRFKKGQLPHNTQTDGSISIRRDSTGRYYKHKRVAQARWELLHRLVWQEHKGPIPEGMCIWFIDGDSLNCDINNLELITRQENMARNSGAVHLPDGMVASYIAGRKGRHLVEELKKMPQLIELKRKQLQLKRAINETANREENTGTPE